jgi:hypothetical protein
MALNFMATTITINPDGTIIIVTNANTENQGLVYETTGFPTIVPTSQVALAIDSTEGKQYQYFNNSWH